MNNSENRMETVVETLKKLHDGSISATQLVQAAFIQAREADSVFISLLEESALAMAHDSDVRRQHGQPLSPLDGLPLAIKDLFDIEGTITTAGSATRSAIAPVTRDAAVIEKLRALGVVFIGKTNLSEFAYSGLGLNPYYGTPTALFANCDLRAPGGSSSGSAIAVQRGIVTATLATDTAGSIRVPAAFNGLVGFKTSSSRHDMSGVHPLAVTLDSLGPIAQTVEDCRLLDNAMRGLSDSPASTVDLSEVRFIVDTKVLQDPRLQPAVARNLERVMDILHQRGAQVERRPVRAVERTRELISSVGWLGAIEAWKLLIAVVEGPDAERMDHRIRTRLLKAQDLTAEKEVQLRVVRQQLIADIAEELGDAILVLPTVFHVAPALAPLKADDELFAQLNLDTLAITMVGSLLDMPGVAMPSGVNESYLPTSILFSSITGKDDRLLDICCAIERAL